MAGVFWPLWLLGGIALLGAAGTIAVAYRRDMRQIRARVASGSRIADTAAGPIEFALEGEGAPILVIHGASGGYDQGLLIARANFAPRFRIIAPSRFGYLRTPLPDDASPARQADAHAALFDALGIDRLTVLGFSAGSRSALQLALRHPERVRGLIIESPVMAAPFRLPAFNRSALGRMLVAIAKKAVDLPYWLAIRTVPSLMIRFSGASAKTYATASPSERGFLRAVMEGMLPLSKRLTGLANDAVNVIESWPLEKIGAPTLIIAVADDLFCSLSAAQAMAARIGKARLVGFPTGSHLLIGHGSEIRAEVADFLAALDRSEGGQWQRKTL